ncbi:MAG TPA: protein translocase subunit SecD [Gemmatimonadaceae bacterium]|jgi:preprotein translocase subunit SecD|nr:protein translocase subunit SecD [Gemmatimonadaceae bacterium]
MSNLKWRLIIIGVLVLASAWALFPRNVKVRQRRADGTFYDTTVYRVPLRKGLDLSGGMHLALEVDDSKGVVADKAEAIDRALKVVRTRIEGLGVSETVIQKAGNDRILVDIPGIDDRERAIKIAQDQAFLEFQITDKTGAFEKALPRLDAIAREKGFGGAVATTGAATPSATNGLNGLLTTGDSAAKSSGAGTSDSARADSSRKDSIAADSALKNASGPISKLISGGQMPGQFAFDRSQYDALKSFFELPAVQAALPPGKVVRFGNDSTVLGGKTYRFLYMLDERPIITGEYLTDAKPSTSTMEGTVVEFTLNNEGGRRFQRETAKHVHDYMAIVLDKVVMGMPPVINSAIGTHGQITMGQGRDLQNAQDLALVLKAGALPVPLRVAEVRNIGPSLGRDSINHALTAGGIAIVLVVVIMLAYYRFSGLLAVAGLALYVLYTLAALAGFDAVLTLPGLAGFVLSIGIAVDANVLIFERIREELARGKTVRTAIDEGFRHAMSAIVDSNVTTILTAMVLYQFGTGPVKGFAVTLIAGIVASMVTSIFVVRTFYLLWLNRSRGAQTLSI